MTQLNPGPVKPTRLIFYVNMVSPRYEHATETIPNEAAPLRKVAYEKWHEARDIVEAWDRGDNEWIGAWQAFDAQRRQWYASPIGEKPSFEAPAPKQGEPDKALLPIPEVVKSPIKVTYRLWIDDNSADHAELLAYYNAMPERDRRRGKFQMLMRLCLVLAAEDPETMRMLQGL